MKKSLIQSILFGALLCMAGAPAYGAGALALDGSEFQVTMYCADDAGDYCSRGDVKNDLFKFEDDSFMIESFDGGVLGVGGSGSFRESGLFFYADYEVVDDNLIDKYTFDVSGASLLDTVLLGQMDITYEKFNFFTYETEDEAKAFFIGVKR